MKVLLERSEMDGLFKDFINSWTITARMRKSGINFKDLPIICYNFYSDPIMKNYCRYGRK